MDVFKFGGASVKSAEAIQNVAFILKNHAPDRVVVVLSAMGKTTNALEEVVTAWYKNDPQCFDHLEKNKNFHLEILDQLFPGRSQRVFQKVEDRFEQVKQYLSQKPSQNFDFEYDQIVSLGEFISTLILSEYLLWQGFDCSLLDATKLIFTEPAWREGKVIWAETEKAILHAVKPVFAEAQGKKIVLTQGFLGGTENGFPTTLGREGSDYTAAIFSYVLDAEEMVLWKDVPGVLNADPKLFADTVLLPEISYREAIELTYYGATIIHPKTIKPLQNKQIPLRVRSFLQPEGAGTLIAGQSEVETQTPSFIVKENQLLVSFSPKDFSFIAEQNLSEIFAAFAQSGIRIHMMQNSAISFTACISQNDKKTEHLFELLEANFSIKYNSDLQLITIRHWTPEAIESVIGGKTVLSETRNRTTVQMVLKK